MFVLLLPIGPCFYWLFFLSSVKISQGPITSTLTSPPNRNGGIVLKVWGEMWLPASVWSFWRIIVLTFWSASVTICTGCVNIKKSLHKPWSIGIADTDTACLLWGGNRMFYIMCSCSFVLIHPVTVLRLYSILFCWILCFCGFIYLSTYTYIHIYTCLYIHIPVYIYIHTYTLYIYTLIPVYIYIYIHTHTYIYLSIYIHIYTCLYICIPVSMCVCVYIYIYIYTYICLYIHIPVYIYIYIRTCLYIYIYIYTYIYPSIYIYIYIHIPVNICIHIIIYTHIYTFCSSQFLYRPSVFSRRPSVMPWITSLSVLL